MTTLRQYYSRLVGFATPIRHMSVKHLYSQRHFPSLDYTISFHIGLMTFAGRSAMLYVEAQAERSQRRIRTEEVGQHCSIPLSKADPIAIDNP